MIELPIESSTVRLPRMLKLTFCLLVAMMPQANGYMSMCDMMQYDEYDLFFHEKETPSMTNASTNSLAKESANDLSNSRDASNFSAHMCTCCMCDHLYGRCFTGFLAAMNELDTSSSSVHVSCNVSCPRDVKQSRQINASIDRGHLVALYDLIDFAASRAHPTRRSAAWAAADRARTRAPPPPQRT